MANGDKPMRYFRVKEGTKAYEGFYTIWHQEDKWLENKDKIEALIGCPMRENLAMNVEELFLSEVPDHLAKQFTIHADQDGFFKAKKNSEIRVGWLDLVKELGLTYLSRQIMLRDLGVNLWYPRKVKIMYPPIGDNHYFAGYDKVEVHGSRKETIWADTDWAEEMKESEFLRIRADWLEATEGEKSNAEETDSTVGSTQAGQ